MHVDPAQREDGEELRPENPPEGGNDQKLGSEGTHLLDRGRVEAVGLQHGETQLEGLLLDGRGLHAPAAAHGLVAAGEDGATS